MTPEEQALIDLLIAQYGFTPEQAFMVAAQAGGINPDAFGSNIYDTATGGTEGGITGGAFQNPGIGDVMVSPMDMPAPLRDGPTSSMQAMSMGPSLTDSFQDIGPRYPADWGLDYWQDILASQPPSLGPGIPTWEASMAPQLPQQQELPPDLDNLIMDEILMRLMADARNSDVDRAKNRTVGSPPGLRDYATDQSQDARAMTADLMQSAFDRARLARMMEELDQPPAMIRAKTQPGGLSGIDMMQAMDDRRGDEIDMRNDFIRGSVMSAPARERSVGQQKPIYDANRPVANKGQIISSQRNKGQRGEQMSSQRNSNATRLKSAATQRQSTPRPTQTYTPPPAPSRGTAAARVTAPPPPKYVPQGDMKNVGRGRR